MPLPAIKYNKFKAQKKPLREIDKVTRRIKGIKVEYKLENKTLLVRLFIPQNDFIGILYSYAIGFSRPYYLIPPHKTTPILRIENHKFTIKDVSPPSSDDDRTLFFNESDYRYRGAETEIVLEKGPVKFQLIKKIFRRGEGSQQYQENINKLIKEELTKEGSSFKINGIPYKYKYEHKEYSEMLLYLWIFYFGMLIGTGFINLIFDFINLDHLFYIIMAIVIFIGLIIYILTSPNKKFFVFEGKYRISL